MPPGHPYLSRLSQVVRWGLHPHLFFPVSDLMPKPCQGLSLSVRPHPTPPRSVPSLCLLGLLLMALGSGDMLWELGEMSQFPGTGQIWTFICRL